MTEQQARQIYVCLQIIVFLLVLILVAIILSTYTTIGTLDGMTRMMPKSAEWSNQSVP